jgi:hypothetical protein
MTNAIEIHEAISGTIFDKENLHYKCAKICKEIKKQEFTISVIYDSIKSTHPRHEALTEASSDIAYYKGIIKGLNVEYDELMKKIKK